MARKANRHSGANQNGGNQRGLRCTHSNTKQGGITSNDPVRIYDRRGRMIGEVNGEGEARQFQKHLQRSKHFLQSFNAWAWDETTLQQAQNAGARQVLIIDDESGQWYRASMDTVNRRGFRLPFDSGQIALRLSHFRRKNEGAQLALFGGAS